jgi:RHS repeat-associated protein
MGSAASGFKENRLKYQSKAYLKDLGLNWMNFHARQYDPQLGRFLGVDPHSFDYTSISPYAAMNNSPAEYVDPDGKDARVSIQKDDKGNITIKLSSTIYVMGYNATQGKVDGYNQYLEENQSMMTQVFNNDDGTTTTMIVDVKFAVATQSDIERVTNENTRNGDNLMILGNDEGRSTGGFVKREVKDPITGKVTEEKFTDFKARLGNKDSETGRFYSKPSTAFHEVMHLFCKLPFKP